MVIVDPVSADRRTSQHTRSSVVERFPDSLTSELDMTLSAPVVERPAVRNTEPLPGIELVIDEGEDQLIDDTDSEEIDFI